MQTCAVWVTWCNAQNCADFSLFFYSSDVQEVNKMLQIALFDRAAYSAYLLEYAHQKK